MTSNLPIQTEEVTIHFDAIEDYSEKSWLMVIDGNTYYMAKSQVRVYHNSKKMYVPTWIAEEKGLI